MKDMRVLVERDSVCMGDDELLAQTMRKYVI